MLDLAHYSFGQLVLVGSGAGVLIILVVLGIYCARRPKRDILDIKRVTTVGDYRRVEHAVVKTLSTSDVKKLKKAAVKTNIDFEVLSQLAATSKHYSCKETGLTPASADFCRTVDKRLSDFDWDLNNREVALEKDLRNQGRNFEKTVGSISKTVPHGSLATETTAIDCRQSLKGAGSSREANNTKIELLSDVEQQAVEPNEEEAGYLDSISSSTGCVIA